jgi:hypothetical protein
MRNAELIVGIRCFLGVQRNKGAGKIFSGYRSGSQGWGCSPVVEGLPRVCNALGSFPALKNKSKKKRKKKTGLI